MKLGFIGCGNMATAMIGGIIGKGIVKPEAIMATATKESTIANAKENLHIQGTLDNHEAAVWADLLFLAVKPQYMDEVLKEIRGDLREDQVIVSIAAGKTIAWYEERIGTDKKIVRTMPNTPALVGEGMTGVTPNRNVTEEELSSVCNILESFGKAEVVPEHLLDVVVGVSGSSPAYVFMFVEAMADAAVAGGMPRNQAYEFAAQAVLGSARMVLETKKHPGELKDMVCSPGGTTIEAVRILEKLGMRSSVMEAVKACIDKSRSL